MGADPTTSERRVPLHGGQASRRFGVACGLASVDVAAHSQYRLRRVALVAKGEAGTRTVAMRPVARDDRRQ